jgi:hypothetical protein
MMPRTIRPLLGAALVLVAVSLSAAQPAGKAELPTVSYPELGKMVRSLRGKVVVVYFWADY